MEGGTQTGEGGGLKPGWGGRSLKQVMGGTQQVRGGGGDSTGGGGRRTQTGDGGGDSKQVRGGT